MYAITEKQLRAAFVNASQRERTIMTLPSDFAALDWEALDYLGWRDARLAGVGYIVAELDGEAVGIQLRRAESKPRSRAQCSWCEDVYLPNDVVFYSAKRAGKAGRNGNTVGTLVCEGFECQVNARRTPPPAYLGYDVDAARERRIEAMRVNVSNFVRDVRDSD